MFGVSLIALGVFVFKTIEKNQLEDIQQFYQQQDESIYFQEIVETGTGVELNTGNIEKIVEEPISITTENKDTTIQKLIKSGYKPKEVSLFQEQKNTPSILEGTKPISIAKNKKLPVSVVLKSTNTLQNKYAEAELPADTYVKTKNNISYTKKIEKPKFVDPKQYNLDNKEAVAMIDVGSDLESIFFQDEQGNPKDVIIRIPAPGYEIGTKANVYSSEDGADWKFHTAEIVKNIENAPYVEFMTTHFTLFAVGAIQWDNDNFLTEEFWDNNPSDEQIIRALYGDGSDGVERTAYTRYWTGVSCITGNMSVVYLSGGTGTIPLNLSENTIYVLESGSYISTGYIQMTGCSAIVGKTGDIILFSSEYLSGATTGLITIDTKNNIVLDNIKIDGSGDGLGGSHVKNYNGIWLNYSSNNTLSKIVLYNNYEYGINFYSSNNNFIDNSKLYNNRYGINFYSSRYNSIDNSETYNNSIVGIHLSNNSSYNIINNLKTYNNSHGIYLYAGSHYNIFTNIQSYNNSDGIGMYSSNYNVFNNIQSYNNSLYGLYLSNNSNNTLNNVQSYNNLQQGIYLNSSSNNVFNNVQSYNNLQQGIYFNGSSNNILNQVYVLNNTIGIALGGTSTGNKYYGKLRLYENDIDWDENTGGISMGDQSTYSTLGWTGGYLDYSTCFRCANITNPINVSSGELTDTGIYRSCNSRGKISGWTSFSGENINYIYGANIPKQIQPVQYSGSSIINSSLEYSGDLYIGEINKIGENNDTQCNNCEFSVNWDNDNFIDTGFWDQNPNSCDIVAALYGTGIYGEDITAYSLNRTGAQNGNLCDVENMRVEYVSPGTNVLQNNLSSNTIYILQSGLYISDYVLNINKCTALITKNGTGFFYTSINQLRSFYINKVKNAIFENIVINGSGNGLGGIHTKNSAGIYFIGETTYFNNNNLLHNIEVFDHSNNGIYLSRTNNTIFKNISSYNNSSYGLSINTSSYNIFDNIYTYGINYGLYFASSNYNILKNIYTHNNIQGIYIASSDYNTFTNSEVYSNSNYGVNINSSDYNNFIDIDVYNNNSDGYYLYTSNNNYVNNSKIYDNNIGITIRNSSTNNIFENSSIYGNSSNGIYMYSTINNVFNNLQLYNNNGIGVYLGGSSNYNVFNNIQSYNNRQRGFFLSQANYNVFNNIQSYNNKEDGISLSTSSNNILHNIIVLNNSTGIYVSSSPTSNIYYGSLQIYENDVDRDVITGSLLAGGNEYSNLGWSVGILNNLSCFRCANITNPINISSGALTDTGIYWSCNSRGQIVGWNPLLGEDIVYIYGTNIPKQIQPVQYSGLMLTGSNLSYSGDLYIGEINNIGENNDTTCSNCSGNYTASWNNNNFIDTGFWDQNPNSCDVVVAVYGTGIYGEDITAYTENWTGAQNGNLCDVENMRVEYISPGTNKLPQYLGSNTIYVLNSGSYISDYTLYPNKCTAFITKNGTGFFYTSNNQVYSFYDNFFDNIVIENIFVDGTNDGIYGSHTRNTYGIYLKSIKNSTLHNLQTTNNTNGLYIWGMNNSTLDNIISHDNTSYGLVFYTNRYNIVKNIYLYNNIYGLYIYNSSSNNIFDNMYIYNNTSNGIEIRSKSNNNIITNMFLDNNSYGLSIGGNSQTDSSTDNVIENISVSNNDLGISLHVNSSGTTIKNATIYNNNSEGIIIDGSTDNILDNILFYNNDIGLAVKSYSSYYAKRNAFSNIQSFNNLTNGIYIDYLISGNAFHNISLYNNGLYGLYFNNINPSINNLFNDITIYNNKNGIYLPYQVTGNYIYGYFNVFGNQILDIDGTGQFIFGGSEYNGLGRTLGQISNGGIIGRNILTNIIDVYGNYLLPWTGSSWTGLISKNFLFTGSVSKISYGYDIPKQKKPVIYSGDILLLSGHYDGEKYIGSDIVSLTGYLSGWNEYWTNSFLDVSVLGGDNLNYLLFGDLFVIYTGITNTLQSVSYSAGTSDKTIIAQIYDDNNFATHFVYTSTYGERPYVEIPNTLNTTIIKTEFSNDGYIESTGSVSGFLTGYMIGTKKLSFEKVAGKLSIPVVIQSNGTFKAEVELPSGITFKTNGGDNYTGIFESPSLGDTGSILLSGVYGVVSIGSTTTSLQVKNDSNNPVPVTIRVPVQGVATGTFIEIYSSQDNGVTRGFHTGATVMLIGGISYVEFTTTHFTDFAITLEGSQPISGTFVINNDDISTTTLDVTLNMTISSPISGMRFSNEGTGDRSVWENYSSTKLRNLTGDEGIKTVYVEFDFTGDNVGDIITNDSIEYALIPSNDQEGELTLEILSGTSECVYGTSLNLGYQDVKLNEAYSFSGTFTGARYCADYIGNSDGWIFTIEVDDLNNGNGGIISGSNLLISHGGAVTQGESSCTGYNGAASQFYLIPKTLIEKPIGSDKICKVILSDVNIEINIPANQAPGSYAGTLTIYVPNF